VTLLHNKNMLATIIHALADSGLEPACLELEVSSAVLSARDAHAAMALRQIKALGVSLIISMSAPGTSDFEDLKNYRPDKIKFEASAVGELLNGSDAAPVQVTLLKNAHDNGMAVIAEGVDDEVAFNAVVQCGCDLGQGLYFMPAIPFEETAAYLQDFHPPHPKDEICQGAAKRV
jgi:EAL domain-containing protein (putative c-di-GMP-specific phosphodiesterase class I)